MAFSDFLIGQSAKTERHDTLNPEQNSLLQQLLASINPQQFNLGQNPLYQSGVSYLQQLLSGSPEASQAFEAPYRSDFEQNTIPALAERFAGMGAQSSSGFQNALGQAGAGLQQQLAALRASLQGGAAQQALGYSQAPGQMGLGAAQLGLGTSPFAYSQRAASTGALGGLLSGVGKGAGMALGGGGIGALGGLLSGFLGKE